MKGLSFYLNKYYKFQQQIVLVNRRGPHDNWSDRCLFLDDKYSAHKPYNHRSILQNEVIIEFDEEDPVINSRVTQLTVAKLNRDNIVYARWKSGNKSQHIHIFIDFRNAQNLSLLKNAFMRHYGTYYVDESGHVTEEPPQGKYRKILPDLRLCSENHLIRAENGLHEKSGNHKKLLVTRGSYPEFNPVPQVVWDKYLRQQQINATRRLLKQENTDDMKKKMNFLLNTTTFKEYNDGRERALFMIIHYLKPSYTDKKAELVKYLIDWYKYSGGYKLTESQIKSKVDYHWNKSYYIERMLDELIETL